MGVEIVWRKSSKSHGIKKILRKSFGPVFFSWMIEFVYPTGMGHYSFDPTIDWPMANKT